MLKNAIAYILRKRSRTVIIFIILTIVLSCLYSCLNIMKSTISLENNLYKLSNTSLSITQNNNENFKTNQFKEIENIKEIKETIPQYDGLAKSTNIKAVEGMQMIERDDLPENFKNILSVEATNNTEKNNLFNSGIFTLIKGRHIEKDDREKIIIHEELAQKNNLGLNDKIYFTGYLNSKQVQKMYKCADVAVFPSTYEPFGIVALEAMLAGVPTVVSDVGGLDEIVTHGVDGMKSYAGNANSIADSVTALLYDHQLATNVSKKAKQKVKDQFNWEKIAQDTHFTYEKAICQTMAERQAKQMLQEKAKKTEKAENSQKEITNLLSFKKRHAYA